MKDCCSTKGNKKVLDYIGIGVMVLLLVGSAIVGFSFSSSGEVVVEEDLDLEQYRVESIPSECRLPIYESRIESWKEHLGYDEDTHYCLDYFE